jgi:uncharacterized protein (TIGR03437 family)
VSVTIQASTLPIARTGSIFIRGTNFSSTVPVSEGAAVCSMTLDPTSSTIPVAGGSSGFSVQTPCTWSVVSNASWLTITSPFTPSGAKSLTTVTGSGMVTYTATPNTCVTAQTGLIVVSSQPNQAFTVTENGSPNNLTISPATLSAPQSASTGHFNVTTGVSCTWSAFSDVSWIHITSTANGAGNGGLGYSIDLNPGAQRSGAIHVGSQAFAVTQAGVTTPAMTLSAVENAASYVSGSVAPGEIVALFGSNMGPVAGVGAQLSANKQSLTNTLGGVQVLFDGNPVTLTYASATQIDAIVPVGVAGKGSTQVQVTYQGLNSNTMTMPVVDTAPGIFAADSSGGGGGAILNQDYSLNARLNPAARGSVIAIYMTGAGATTPAAVDGAITSTTAPFPSVVATVTVSIGGVTVPSDQVVYRGAAPGSVEGLTQIDAYVPQSVTPGSAVPVIVTVGGVASQANLTVSVN